jgi:hypothetical protein
MTRIFQWGAMVLMATQIVTAASGQTKMPAAPATPRPSAPQPELSAPAPGSPADSNIFEPFNQRECDYPSACGCDCDPRKTPGPSNQSPPAQPGR